VRLADRRKEVPASFVGFAAGVAQLVEHDVANVVVVGSNPITRSFWPSAVSHQPSVLGHNVKGYNFLAES
jgi:hypothetical protein